MKTVNVSARSRVLNNILAQARDEDVVVRADDGTQFLVRAIDEFGREIESQRRNEKLMAYLDQCAKDTEWVPLADVEKKLRLPPRKGSKKAK